MSITPTPVSEFTIAKSSEKLISYLYLKSMIVLPDVFITPYFSLFLQENKSL